MRQRVRVMLVTVAVLPDSLRAFWAAWRSTALLQSEAVPDAVVVVEAAGAVVVDTGAAVEDGVLAVLSGLEELHPAASRATSTARTSKPMVVRPITSPLFVWRESISGGFKTGKLRALAYQIVVAAPPIRSLIAVGGLKAS